MRLFPNIQSVCFFACFLIALGTIEESIRSLASVSLFSQKSLLVIKPPETRRIENAIYSHQPELPESFQNLFSMFSMEELKKVSKEERCFVFFGGLDYNWKLPTFENDTKYHVNLYDPEPFLSQRAKAGKTISDAENIIEEVFKDITAKVKSNKEIEKKVIDATYIFRTYNACFLKNYEARFCNKIDDRVFPWFTFKSPIYKRWDGLVIDDFNLMRDYYSNLKFPSGIRYEDAICFWNKFRLRIYGKGIVVPISENSLDDLIRLLKVLRFLKNKYPVQFVHTGDLSDSSQKSLVEAARMNLELEGELKIQESEQNIWFVNIKDCLSTNSGFASNNNSLKWLASLLTSFEEIILLNPEVVLFKPISTIFELPSYKSDGAYFFRGRYGVESTAPEITKLFKTMLPSIIENTLFDTLLVTNHTLKNDVFTKKFKNVLDPSVMVINRQRHFPGLLFGTQLNSWGPVLDQDTDFFWVSQSMMGDESYTLDKYSSGAAGILDNSSYENSNVIVAEQQLHLDPSDNYNLLWMSHGFRYCKEDTWKTDVSDFNDAHFTEQELSIKYLSVIGIDSVIIPADVETKTDLIQKPNSPWTLRLDLGCSNQIWEAHSAVGLDTGVEIHYNPEERAHFSKIGHIWGSRILKSD